jgi:hypothetical protein
MIGDLYYMIQNPAKWKYSGFCRYFSPASLKNATKVV